MAARGGGHEVDLVADALGAPEQRHWHTDDAVRDASKRAEECAEPARQRLARAVKVAPLGMAQSASVSLSM